MIHPMPRPVLTYAMGPVLSGFLMAVLAAALMVSLPAQAQDVQIRFGSSLRLEESALEVTADSLEVDQTTGATVFTGNVLAAQGDMRISANLLQLVYEAGATEGSRRIGTLTATGDVAMVTSEEAVEAERAVYSMRAQTLEMTGDVMLVQGPNLLSGERFIADLRNGTGRMTGRVRTIIQFD
ncbi:LptA/OstA family protein [Pararhodobacter oceanensis]|uniref:LptA/OstA family protein n=1 Tax=Pararhodobacter oceanensis TaxID=2172121 RepID=UPI003A913A50